MNLIHRPILVISKSLRKFRIEVILMKLYNNRRAIRKVDLELYGGRRVTALTLPSEGDPVVGTLELLLGAHRLLFWAWYGY